MSAEQDKPVVLDGLIKAMLIREAIASTSLDRDQTIALEEGPAGE